MHTILTELNLKFNPAHASAVISSDGLIISSALPAHIDGDIVAGMCAALFSVGIRSSKELTGGPMEQISIQSPEGLLLINPINQEAMLTMITKSMAGIDPIIDEMKQAAEKLKKFF